MALSCSTQSVLPTMSFRFVFRLPFTSAVARDAGQECAERSADGVNAEGVERVVIAEPALELEQAKNGTRPAATPMIIAPRGC